MSHFAKVENGVVTNVIVATQGEINSERHGDAFNWIQCSYNKNFRGNFPGKDYVYTNGVFVPPKPFDSWVLNAELSWESPSDYPELPSTEDDSELIHYDWNEETQSWDEVTPEV